MSDNVKLVYQGKEFEYPIVQGLYSDISFDISKLRSDTGLITLDIG